MKYFFAMILLVGSVSCNHVPKNVRAIKEIDLYEPLGDYKVSDIFDKIEYIPLETNHSSLIGHINKAIINDNKILILDRTKASSVFLFNIDGSFIRKIGDKGRAENEFIRPDNIYIVNDTLQVLDLFGKKIMFFDLNGNFIKNIKYTVDILDYAPISNEKFCMLAHYKDEVHQHQVLVIDKEGKLVQKFLPYNENLNKLRLRKSDMISNMVDTVLINPLLSNNIYMISESGLESRVNFFSKHENGLIKLSNELIGKNADSYHLQNQLLEFDGFITPYLESRNLIYFEYRLSKKRTTAIFSKNSGNKIVVDNRLIDDLGSLAQITPHYISYDNKFVYVLERSSLNFLFEDKSTSYYKLLSKNKSLQSFLSDEDGISNPWIAVGYVKKDFYEKK